LLITRLDVPPSVVSGTPTKGTVTINAPGGPNGATVALKSSHQNVQVPATVLVPPNATTAEFAITTVAVPPTAPPVSATITATLGTSSVPANITLTPRVG
jgi:hypothetical protein